MFLVVRVKHVPEEPSAHWSMSYQSLTRFGTLPVTPLSETPPREEVVNHSSIRSEIYYYIKTACLKLYYFLLEYFLFWFFLDHLNL